ncbi:MAG: aminoacyl-tRNA hydrolase [Candidatus Doudnabacteria bacterium RIFCSPLOWO2_01_FULL_44_21]|uniref:Peptidyl-tRNA hydrolase n=1 Tax=Candidatus Doudnabacteria bacterium RIFCSPLOWO2_01_FULL_44_21 TaxID=1817841 RepID=A0A1F5Q2G3_9BACT|nr:MAG: aminoacyl-tRNA hydrolase [Candidatus Doudnabacteria bacterium RIFCSPHIGHO2_02_FULL_43_13b]OGE96395.1 MAG: aminoacyl-tRNA hydrolase [Candidatus Doudnabacteria bacterium RIFCSPLOWO2_01_FULL_44_21]
MYLIVGLGNPGKQYEQTRHNMGFRVLDLIAGITKWENKYQSQLIKLEDVILAKPQTFMNKSGEAVKEILKYYPAPEMLIVTHDDLDLPLGTIRIQKNISGAGHNGVQNIIDELGTQDFIRIRLGIDSPSRGQIPGDDYVLQKFSTDEEKIVLEVLEKTKDAIETLQTQGFEMAQSKFNG